MQVRRRPPAAALEPKEPGDRGSSRDGNSYKERKEEASRQESPALGKQSKRTAEGTQLASSQEGDDQRDWGASPGNSGRKGRREGRADRGMACGRREAAPFQDAEPGSGHLKWKAGTQGGPAQVSGCMGRATTRTTTPGGPEPQSCTGVWDFPPPAHLQRNVCSHSHEAGNPPRHCHQGGCSAPPDTVSEAHQLHHRGLSPGASHLR